MSHLKNFFAGKYEIRNHEGRKIYLRRNNVDNQVFDYVFGDKYHRPLIDLKKDKPIILDLGVNIGLSVVDFKLLYPSAIIYGYELDKNNAEIALKNTAGMADVFINNKGIWHSQQMVAISGTNADALKITEGNSGNTESLVSATTIPDVIAEYGIKHIDYIKMDIEGAEHEIFQHDLKWLEITNQVKVEIHDGQHVFDFIWKKLEDHGFKTVKDTHHWSTLIGYKDES